MPSTRSDELSKIDVAFSVPFTHRLRFTNDLIEEDWQVLLDVIRDEDSRKCKVMVVVDSQVWLQTARIGKLLERLSQASHIQVVGPLHESLKLPIVEVAGGEQIKNSFAPFERILKCINDYDLDRRSYIVVIGGGAVLDAVGYAAAIAHRGLRLVRIPTTTLAQADSGIGVKNAINCFGKKNWVGTFAVPWAVINDAAMLQTLPDRDFRCGFSEAVKVSLLKSVSDFETLCRFAKRIAKREMSVAFPAIKRSCMWHLRHITQGGDPFEVLEARPLDFGHWSAHKLEQLSNYRLRHGEAVGIGVALDCAYSHLMLGLSKEQLLQICKCLGDLGMTLWDDTLNQPESVLQGLEEFRQHLGGRLTITMLKRIGESVDVHEVDRDVMKQAIDLLKSNAALVARSLQLSLNNASTAPSQMSRTH